ncbi:hypothetical protein FS837_004980 [Tulasnella sp. UAMH 9824]|nr:hypothetical protein FS837_004980 [Tulasnella sp. UAMH 9824]
MLSLRPTQESHTFNFSARTPGRTRLVNVPSTLLKENASRRPNTVKPTRTAYPATPASKLGYTVLEDNPTALKPSAALATTSRLGLVDKTNKTPYAARLPFPVTPVPSGKLQLGATPRISIDPPASVLRPSSTRKSLRAPRKSYETPEPTGRRPHWDISDGEIDAEINLSAGTSSQEIIVEEDDDEVEYMPDSVPEEIFDPGFDMPDYRALGADVMYFDKHPTTGIEWEVDWNSMPEPAELIHDPQLRPKRAYAPENPFFRPSLSQPGPRQLGQLKPGAGLKKRHDAKLVSRPPTSNASRPSSSRHSNPPLRALPPPGRTASTSVKTTRGLSKANTNAHQQRPEPKPTSVDSCPVGSEMPFVAPLLEDFHFDV